MYFQTDKTVVAAKDNPLISAVILSKDQTKLSSVT